MRTNRSRDLIMTLASVSKTPRFFGWHVVAATFVLAIFGWGGRILRTANISADGGPEDGMVRRSGVDRSHTAFSSGCSCCCKPSSPLSDLRRSACNLNRFSSSRRRYCWLVRGLRAMASVYCCPPEWNGVGRHGCCCSQRHNCPVVCSSPSRSTVYGIQRGERRRCTFLSVVGHAHRLDWILPGSQHCRHSDGGRHPSPKRKCVSHRSPHRNATLPFLIFARNSASSAELAI